MLLPVTYERPLTAMRSLLEDFFNEPFFSMSDRNVSGRMWPKVDIVEEKKQFCIKADLPGMKREDIKVEIEGTTLSLSGEKKEEKQEQEGAYGHFERSYGAFQRTFTLPENVDPNSIDAVYKNGVLEVSLKKTGEIRSKTKEIEVKIES
jgi:HSP20 family protein